MKKIIWVFIILSLLSCKQSPSPKTDNNSKIQSKLKYHVVTYNYESASIPIIISKLYSNHIKDFMIIDSIEFFSFCSKYTINPKDTSNINKYFTIKILHDIFTCFSATNCSSGEIINIPYFWHVIKPNPRYEIQSTENGKLLKDIKPPKEFSKFKTFADIDRTPVIFLTDMFETKQKYYTSTCDTFSTFGWCSEREMAFGCITDLLNYKVKIVGKGNHCWTEFIISLNTIDNKTKSFNVKIDNTFNEFEWEESNNINIVKWDQYIGNIPDAKWYNREIHSQENKKRLNNFIVSQQAINRIEKNIIKYINKKINEN